jgi:pSer/pThr/pTyr-binding forkhead associated (FHA) protein
MRQGVKRRPRRWIPPHPLVAPRNPAPAFSLSRVKDSPLDAHVATPQDLKERIAAERRGTPFLVFRNADDLQVIVDLLPEGERLTIGRRPSNDIVLDWDSEISRVHAALELIGEDWTVVDDGLSHNGTYLNGHRVTSRQRLKDGDVLSVGTVTIAYRAPGGESVSRPTVTALGPHVGELLTPAQRRVLVALCRPFKDATYATPATNQQIADELVVSVDAVKSTLRALFEVFGVDALPQNQKRASLALQALRTGVITRRDL